MIHGLSVINIFIIYIIRLAKFIKTNVRNKEAIKIAKMKERLIWDESKEVLKQPFHSGI